MATVTDPRNGDNRAASTTSCWSPSDIVVLAIAGITGATALIATVLFAQTFQGFTLLCNSASCGRSADAALARNAEGQLMVVTSSCGPPANLIAMWQDDQNTRTFFWQLRRQAPTTEDHGPFIVGNSRAGFEVDLIGHSPDPQLPLHAMVTFDEKVSKEFAVTPTELGKEEVKGDGPASPFQSWDSATAACQRVGARPKLALTAGSIWIAATATLLWGLRRRGDP